MSVAFLPRSACVLLAWLVAGFTNASAAGPRAPDGGGGFDATRHADRITPAFEATLSAEESASEARLLDLGQLHVPVRTKVAGLIWPLAPSPGVGIDWHGVSNFVDLDPLFPGMVRDFTCATRSYDTAAGYNHRGTDLFTWPFAWTLLDDGAIDVVAAAPGTIITKVDGNPDRSCSMNAPDTANYVSVRHTDGTLARYLHLKTGSTTSKAVGATVVTGEFLGKVGSSGISTGPHLHFELRTSTATNAATIDPFNGACNEVASAWSLQRPYYDSRLNRVATHASPPSIPDCPATTDTPNLSDAFDPGARVVVAAYYRDQRRGQVSQLRVLRPDSSVFTSWTFDMAQVAGSPPHYNASYWYWNVDLPAAAGAGLWTFEATFEGETRQHAFSVGDVQAPIRDPRGLTGAWYEPATSGQGFEFHWIETDRLLVFYYGHHDDGRNLHLVGTRDGRFAYGDDVEVPLFTTSGGRFNGLDPAQVRVDAWGSVRLRVDDCDHVFAQLTGNDGTQGLHLVRLSRMPGMGCD